MRKTISGFTIVELLIVVIVIAILAAISIVAYTSIQNRAHTSAVQSDIANNTKKLAEYRVLNGEYPDTQAEFRSAGLKFSLGSYTHALYCVRNSGTDPNWVLVVRTRVGEDIYHTPQAAWQPYAGGWPTAVTICESAGLTSPDVASWLAANGVWTAMVVY